MITLHLFDFSQLYIFKCETFTFTFRIVCPTTKKTIQAKCVKLVVADVIPKESKTHLDVGALQQGEQANESEGKAGE